VTFGWTTLDRGGYGTTILMSDHHEQRNMEVLCARIIVNSIDIPQVRRLYMATQYMETPYAEQRGETR